jgi:peptide chain release factor 1
VVDARLRQALARAEEVARELADPETARTPARLKALGREHARLEQVRQTAAQLARASDELAQAREVARDPDPATAQLGREEAERIAPTLEPLERQLDELLTPTDPLDDRDAIVEIRAGTGGDEAALFAADLLRMYRRYCERQGWTVELLDVSEGALRSVKEAVLPSAGPRFTARSATSRACIACSESP